MIKILKTSNHQIAYTKVNYKRSSELFEYLKDSGIKLTELANIRNPRRQIEWMTVRKILLKIYPEFGDIYYDAHGKPHFTESKKHLSISHSHEMVAVAIHKTAPTGIDLQHISDKIIHIKNKFLCVAEQNRTGNDALELTYYWSCKEALFKVYGKKDGFLKANFLINKIAFNEIGGSAEGIIKIGKHKSVHRLKMRRIENYVLAYVVNS